MADVMGVIGPGSKFGKPWVRATQAGGNGVGDFSGSLGGTNDLTRLAGASLWTSVLQT